MTVSDGAAFEARGDDGLGEPLLAAGALLETEAHQEIFPPASEIPLEEVLATLFRLTSERPSTWSSGEGENGRLFRVACPG